MSKQIKIYWPDKTTYFLTGSTFLHYPYFDDFDKKLIVLNQIKKIQEKLLLKDIIFSIAVNHYHLKFYLEKGSDLAVVKKYMHGGTSFEYKKKYPLKYSDMWQTPKALRVISDEMDWKVTGYIVGNLLKHKEVGKISELSGNIFTSYDTLVKKCGKGVVDELVREIIAVTETADGEISLQEMKNIKIKKAI